MRRWGGVPDRNVYFETFGPSTVKKTLSPFAGKLKERAKTTEVTFNKSNRTVPWSESCGNILELAEEVGISIPSGCRTGNCGTCNVAVNEGEFKHVQEPGFSPDDGTCLTCIAIPEGNIVIDA